MANLANFQILDPETGSVFKEYSMEYTDAPHLHSLYQEAREVWYDYVVSVDVDLFRLSHSHTYAQEVREELSADSPSNSPV